MGLGYVFSLNSALWRAQIQRQRGVRIQIPIRFCSVKSQNDPDGRYGANNNNNRVPMPLAFFRAPIMDNSVGEKTGNLSPDQMRCMQLCSVDWRKVVHYIEAWS